MDQNQLKCTLIQQMADRKSSELLLSGLLGQAMFEFLQEHNLLAIFSSLNSWCEHEELKKYQRKNQIRNLVYLEESQKLAREFPEQLVGLKGIALLNSCYEISERSMSDVDVLAVNIKSSELDQKLLKLGYKKVPEKKWWANNFKTLFIKETSVMPVTLEVHYKLFYNEPDDFKWNFNPSLNNNLADLQPNYQWVHLMGHYAHQHTFLKLFWLLDLFFYLDQNKDVLNNTMILNLAKKLKLLRAQGGVIKALDVLGLNSEDVFKKENANYWDKKITNQFLLDPKAKTLKYLQIKHGVKESALEAIKYDLAWIFNKRF